MKPEKLQDAIGMIGDDLIYDAKTSNKTVKIHWRKWSIMAAALLVLFVTIGIPLWQGKLPLIVSAIVQKTIKFPESGLKEDWEAVEPKDSAESAGINIKGELLRDDCTLPICYSEEYDAIYYVDYSNNNFIYRCKDNDIKLAVKIPANYLYMNDGELYFRVEDGNYILKNMNAGDVYKYSPLTGEIKKVIEVEATGWMMISENGIYYEVAGELQKEVSEDGTYYTKSIEMFYYDFEKAVSEKVKAWSEFVLWKEDYSIVPYSSSLQGGNEGIIGLGLYKIGTELSDVEPIIIGERCNYYCVQGDVLYCEGNQNFRLVHLDTGEIKEYSHSFLGGLGNFMVQNNRVYNQSLSYFIDLETGESYSLHGEVSGRINRLFNINNKLYALYYEKENRAPEILEVVVDEEPALLQIGDGIYKNAVCFELKKIGE